MILELELERVDGRVIKPDPALEAKLLGSVREACDRDAVPKHIVHPMQRRRFGRDGDGGLDQPLVVAVARPEHDPMLTKCDWLAIAVGCDVADREDRHGAA